MQKKPMPGYAIASQRSQSRETFYSLSFFSLDENNIGIAVTKFNVVRYFIEH